MPQSNNCRSSVPLLHNPECGALLNRDIAAHLGMAPETLTRTFAKLERKEIIEVVADGVVFLDARESPGRGKMPVLGTRDSHT